MIAIGVVVDTRTAEYMGFVSISVNPVALWFKIFGAFTFSSGFFGCCGARKSHFFVVCTVCLCGFNRPTPELPAVY